MLGYAQLGSGEEKVMVVHGWKTDHTCFDAMLSSLDQKRYTYIFVDMRGYGKSIHMEGPFTVEQVAADMVALSKQLGWDKYHIIGHSMGGKVIQRIMADCPDKIKSAIGITPCPACSLPFDEQAWKLFSGADVNSENRLQVFRHSTGNRLTDTWYEAITAMSFKMSTPEAFRQYLDSWVHYDLVEDVKGSTIPIKVIAGEHDPDLNLDVMQNTYNTWLPNAQITELPNCGHYPMLETPLSLAAACESFLDRHTG